MGLCGLKGDSCRAVVFRLAAHWAHSDAFKNSDAQALHDGDSDSVGQFWSLGVGIFEKLPKSLMGSHV